ncbi:MAG: hypothetical protein RLZ51_2655, partial [Pseudomonadota bacterium]
MKRTFLATALAGLTLAAFSGTA